MYFHHTQFTELQKGLLGAGRFVYKNDAPEKSRGEVDKEKKAKGNPDSIQIGPQAAGAKKIDAGMRRMERVREEDAALEKEAMLKMAAKYDSIAKGIQNDLNKMKPSLSELQKRADDWFAAIKNDTQFDHEGYTFSEVAVQAIDQEDPQEIADELKIILSRIGYEGGDNRLRVIGTEIKKGIEFYKELAPVAKMLRDKKRYENFAEYIRKGAEEPKPTNTELLTSIRHLKRMYDQTVAEDEGREKIATGLDKQISYSQAKDKTGRKTALLQAKYEDYKKESDRIYKEWIRKMRSYAAEKFGSGAVLVHRTRILENAIGDEGKYEARRTFSRHDEDFIYTLNDKDLTNKETNPLKCLINPNDVRTIWNGDTLGMQMILFEKYLAQQIKKEAEEQKKRD